MVLANLADSGNGAMEGSSVAIGGGRVFDPFAGTGIGVLRGHHGGGDGSMKLLRLK